MKINKRKWPWKKCVPVVLCKSKVKIKEVWTKYPWKNKNKRKWPCVCGTFQKYGRTRDGISWSALVESWTARTFYNL